MGNRAVITTRKDLKDIGVYLHWNGGRDSVERNLESAIPNTALSSVNFIVSGGFSMGMVLSVSGNFLSCKGTFSFGFVNKSCGLG